MALQIGQLFNASFSVTEENENFDITCQVSVESGKQVNAINNGILRDKEGQTLADFNKWTESQLNVNFYTFDNVPAVVDAINSFCNSLRLSIPTTTLSF